MALNCCVTCFKCARAACQLHVIKKMANQFSTFVQNVELPHSCKLSNQLSHSYKMTNKLPHSCKMINQLQHLYKMTNQLPHSYKRSNQLPHSYKNESILGQSYKQLKIVFLEIHGMFSQVICQLEKIFILNGENVCEICLEDLPGQVNIGSNVLLT